MLNSNGLGKKKTHHFCRCLVVMIEPPAGTTFIASRFSTTFTQNQRCLQTRQQILAELLLGIDGLGTMEKVVKGLPSM